MEPGAGSAGALPRTPDRSLRSHAASRRDPPGRGYRLPRIWRACGGNRDQGTDPESPASRRPGGSPESVVSRPGIGALVWVRGVACRRGYLGPS